MKKLLVLALVLLSIQSVFAATGSVQKKKKKTVAKTSAVTAPKAKLGTSFKFDGSALRGKYQSSLSTTATVENDKFLDDLLGGRKDFSDRSQKELERN